MTYMQCNTIGLDWSCNKSTTHTQDAVHHHHLLNAAMGTEWPINGMEKRFCAKTLETNWPQEKATVEYRVWFQLRKVLNITVPVLFNSVHERFLNCVQDKADSIQNAEIYMLFLGPYHKFVIHLLFKNVILNTDRLTQKNSSFKQL